MRLAPSRWLSRVNTLGWFLRRPSLYRELFRRCRWALSPTVDPAADPNAEYPDWCAARAVEIREACGRLQLPEEQLDPVDAHQSLFDEADERVSSSGVQMGGAASLTLLYTLCRHLEPQAVVETGVAFGWSSLTLLLALHENGTGRLTSGDMPYPKQGPANRFVGCAVPASLRSRWSLHRLPDRDLLPRLVKRDQHFGLAHYDSDKSYAGRLFGYRTMWDLLEPAGLLVSDDIDRNPAMRDFSEEVGRELLVVAEPGRRLTGILKK